MWWPTKMAGMDKERHTVASLRLPTVTLQRLTVMHRTRTATGTMQTATETTLPIGRKKPLSTTRAGPLKPRESGARGAPLKPRGLGTSVLDSEHKKLAQPALKARTATTGQCSATAMLGDAPTRTTWQSTWIRITHRPTRVHIVDILIAFRYVNRAVLT